MQPEAKGEAPGGLFFPHSFRNPCAMVERRFLIHERSGSKIERSEGNMRQVRRIVTTDDENGKSGVLIDGVASRTITVLTELWITDGKDPNHRDKIDHAERSNQSEPPPAGTLFRYFEIAPESETTHLTDDEKRKANAEWFAA
jgi:hypothetical protein